MVFVVVVVVVVLVSLLYLPFRSPLAPSFVLFWFSCRKQSNKRLLAWSQANTNTVQKQFIHDNVNQQEVANVPYVVVVESHVSSPRVSLPVVIKAGTCNSGRNK